MPSGLPMPRTVAGVKLIRCHEWLTGFQILYMYRPVFMHRRRTEHWGFYPPPKLQPFLGAKFRYQLCLDINEADR